MRALLDLRRTEVAALRDQVVELDAEILRLLGEIATAEREMNALVFRLYRLTPQEHALVFAG